MSTLRAQTVLFSAPETACINQPIVLVPDSNSFHASSYYWGFCSGYTGNAPTGENLGHTFGFHIPSNIDIAYDSGNYYGFVINSQTRELIRLNFGHSLTNIPTTTNFGNLTNGLPLNPTSLCIVKDTLSNNWFVFVTGGYDVATSTLGRVDFLTDLGNMHPNVANFGNYNGMLDYPKGVFVAKDKDHQWHGYVVNHVTSELIRLDFAFNVSVTPLMYDYGNVSGDISNPTDLAAVNDNGKWYLFITNEDVSSSVARIDLDTTLAPDPSVIAATRIGSSDVTDPSPTTFNGRILQPSSISINRDCGNLYAYITDSTTSQLIGIQMATVTGPYNAIDYNNVGFEDYPSSISTILRDSDDLYGFIANANDSTLTRIDLSQCHNSSIPSFTDVTPPVYTYDSPGVYNIYLVLNQGLPNMEVQCKTIQILAYPPIYMNDDTTICQGDTARLYVISNLADSFSWQTGYNIDTSYIYRDSVKVYPNYSTRYPVTIFYPFGCIVDTAVRVHVSRVHADAGPDRWIHDGATTVLGGPYTTIFDSTSYLNYGYNWKPFQYLSDSTVPFPTAFPPYDFTYYLTVTELNDTFHCVAKDTVVVHLNCGDFYLPNAFAPNSDNPATNRFSVLNKEIVKLNYFRVFNRWGVLLFESSDPSVGWDGTYNGQPQPVDVYVWQADGFCLSGLEVKKSGNVSLMR